MRFYGMAGQERKELAELVKQKLVFHNEHKAGIIYGDRILGRRVFHVVGIKNYVKATIVTLF